MKICTMCKEGKPLDEFYTNGKTSAGNTKRKGKCKSCEMISTKERYQAILLEYFGALECSNCGYDKDFRVLDCHHLNPNEKDFTVSSFKSLTRTKILTELSKCSLLCANCHREEHLGIMN